VELCHWGSNGKGQDREEYEAMLRATGHEKGGAKRGSEVIKRSRGRINRNQEGEESRNDTENIIKKRKVKVISE